MIDWQNIWNQTFAKHRLNWVYNLSAETLEFMENLSVTELKSKTNNQFLWLHHATDSDLQLFLATDGNMFGFVKKRKYLVAGILTDTVFIRTKKSSLSDSDQQALFFFVQKMCHQLVEHISKEKHLE